jgi:hypothetical protein
MKLNDTKDNQLTMKWGAEGHYFWEGHNPMGYWVHPFHRTLEKVFKTFKIKD